MSSSRWPRSPSHGKCSRRFCGSSRNCGRSHHQRRREAFDGYAFMSNRQNECVQMPGKMARSDPRLSVRVTRGAGGGHTSRLSCKRAGKTHQGAASMQRRAQARLRVKLPSHQEIVFTVEDAEIIATEAHDFGVDGTTRIRDTEC